MELSGCIFADSLVKSVWCAGWGDITKNGEVSFSVLYAVRDSNPGPID